MTTTTIRIWVHSDLQLAKPAQAQETLSKAVDDLLNLNMHLDGVWCLGDAYCGSDEKSLREVAQINVEQLERLKAPVHYVLGNHEMDLPRSGVFRFPLHELVATKPGWRAGDIDALSFTAKFGDFLVVFMGDHAAPDGSWLTTNGGISGEHYPYDVHSYQQLRQEISDYAGPVIIASHYALPGGQRPSALMERLLPLPTNVRMHLHGHAHIGDLVWNKDNPWQRENPITGYALKQFNISALESLRSPGSHSVLLELHPEAIKLRVRCHLEEQWVDEFRVTW